MSVTNLEAYALTQGITKAFDQMTQGEQTLLRYQYLMQATADAQGDFARTSDSYANAVRTLETNIANLKTSVGAVMIPIVTDVVQGINNMIGALTQQHPTTVLDEFAAIDLKTDEKLRKIQSTADEARALIGVLEEIGGKQITNTSLTNFVDTLTGKLGGLDEAVETAKTGDYAGTISAIAEAMSKNLGGSAAQWETLLTAVSEKLPSAADAALDDKGQTAAFLQAAAAAADDLGGDYSTLWANLLTVLGDDAGPAITALANGATAAAALEGLANGANTLSPTVDVEKWKGLLNALSAEGKIDIAANAGKSIEELTNALTSNDPGERGQAWQDLLGALSSDIESLSKLTGKDAEGIKAWLEGLAEGVNAIDPNDADGWKSLFEQLRGGLPVLTAKDDWIELLTTLQNTGAVDLGSTGQSIEDLATALSDSEPDEKAQAWESFLSALYTDIDNLSALTGEDAEGTRAWLESIAEAAKGLAPDDAAGWATLLGDIRQGLPNLTAKQDWIDVLGALKSTGSIDLSKTGKSISALANALNGEDPGTDRAQAWRELLDALSADVEGLSELTGMSAEDTAEWLSTLAEGANALDPNSAEGWSELFTQLTAGLPGLGELGFAGLFSELGGETGDAEGYLRALGYSTDEIADKQAAWLEVCKRLVKTIPGLNEIINTETGEVKGGVQAISEYVEAWKQGQEKMLLWKAYYAKEEALLTAKAEISGTEVEMIGAQNRVKRLREQIEALKKEAGFTPEEEAILGTTYAAEFGEGAVGEVSRLMIELADAEGKAEKAESAYTRAVNANSEALQGLADMKQGLIDQYGEEEEAAEATAQATEEWSEQMKTSAVEALDSATDALEALDQYYQRVHEDSTRSIQSVVKGFQAIETPAKKARREAKELGEEFEGLSDKEIDLRLAGEGAVPTIQNMTRGLQDQLAYLQQYKDDLAAAQALGIDSGLLATLADGSVESADYLHALATEGDENSVKVLNDAWAAVTDAQEALADSLTETRLKADTEFQGLVDAASAAVEGLNQYGEAKGAMEETVQGIADGIQVKVGTVGAQVDALNSALSRLGVIGGLLGGFGFHLDGSHATGLDYVPFDNYLAQLHEGESVLTAEEARAWRQFKTGGDSVRNNIDYGALSGAIWDNAPSMGGNVYLDGRTVGRVISEQQGNSLRALERSGWQR